MRQMSVGGPSCREVALLIFKQYYLGCLAHASYLVGDEKTGQAAVIDPQRDVGQYLEDARLLGLEIRYAFLTHFHADFIAGHLELRDLVGAEIRLGGRAEADYAFVSMSDRVDPDMGSVRLRSLEKPGHTPEGMSILVYDLETSATAPHAVFTGDTLFIGDVGRPDLLASIGWTASDLASMLYDSLHMKLLTLPDETLVYPAHGAGSACGRNLSTDRVSTIGIQRQYNYALQPMSKEAFVELVTADQPEAPAYFVYDALLNRQERPTLDSMLDSALNPLSLDRVLELIDSGAQVVDVRESPDFAGAHLAGSLNIGLSGSYANWCGTILNREDPIVIVAEPGGENEAAVRLARIGFDHVAGYLDGGMQALASRTDLLGRMERITAATLAEQLGSAAPPVVLDVRAESEWTENAIAGSMLIPLNHLAERIDQAPEDRSIVVHCRTGYRSSIAASMLQKHGRNGVADLVGGIAAWEASKLETVSAANP
jgi:rhodanese-related sulfurtransferase/glyoxylase-like metal-dependent hydrolase (beta-lactamase superfamily II)